MAITAPTDCTGAVTAVFYARQIDFITNFLFNSVIKYFYFKSGKKALQNLQYGRQRCRCVLLPVME